MSRSPGTARSLIATPRPSGIVSDCGVELLFEKRIQALKGISLRAKTPIWYAASSWSSTSKSAATHPWCFA